MTRPQLELRLLQRIIVAGYRAVSAHKTRQVLLDLEPHRLRDINLDRSDIDRAAKNAANRASQAFARRLQVRQRSADQGSGPINSQFEFSMAAGKMMR